MSDGYLDDDGSAAAIFQPGEGAPEDIADFGREVDRLGRLRKRLHRLAGIEIRLDIGKPPRITHRQHQHGHGLAIALCDAAHGIFRAGPMLHAEGADGVPGTDPGNRVRHMQSDPLLPHHHRADVGVGRVLNEMIDRIAAENLDSLALHDFCDGGAEFHADSSPRPAEIALDLCRLVGTGIVRPVKLGRGVCREPLLSRFASPAGRLGFSARGSSEGPAMWFRDAAKGRSWP